MDVGLSNLLAMDTQWTTNTIAVASEDGMIHIINGELASQSTLGGVSRIKGCGWRTRHELLTVGGYEVLIWSLSTPEDAALALRTPGTTPYTCVATSPNESHVVAAGMPLCH
jgi:hypothetical protein